MVHSNPVDQKCSHGQCRHGRCHGHGPEWENLGEKWRESNPGIFGQKTFWLIRCCGAPMARMKEGRTRQCKKCGRMEDSVTRYHLALCRCCGRTIDVTPDDYD